MRKEIKYILFFLLLNLMAACLFKAKAQTIVQPDFVYQMGADTVSVYAGTEHYTYRIVIATPKEIIADFSNIARCYVSALSACAYLKADTTFILVPLPHNYKIYAIKNKN